LVWLELVRWDIKVAKNMPQNYPPAGGRICLLYTYKRSTVPEDDNVLTQFRA